MPTTSRRRLSTAAVVLGLVALAGCSDASDGNAGTAPPTVTSEPPSPLQSSSPAEPSPSPVRSSAPPSSSAPSTPASSAPPAAIADLLLGADELPGLNARFAWSEGRTLANEPASGVGTCERFPLGSIGATDVAYRSYTPPPRSVDSAEELVADFPDSTTAQRAYSVLKSWHATCRSRLRGKDVRQIGDLQAVRLGSGTGGWYLLVYGPAPGDPDSGVFDAQGIAVVGTRVAMVELKSIGQDYDYPQGKEPMVGALQAAAQKLAG